MPLFTPVSDAARLSRLETQVAHLLRAIDQACELIELGDQRLLATDGPIANEAPKMTLSEWRTMYRVLEKARKAVRVERVKPR